MKPRDEPLTREGGTLFCQGCKQWVTRLIRVEVSRYRCDRCAAGKDTKR